MASEISHTIPPEIITNILYRLPAKSLGRFRCVSKDWLSLISEPEFIKTHQTTHNQNHIIFASNSLYSLPIPHHDSLSILKPQKLNFESNHVDFTVHGSCNGLILVSAYDSNGVHKLLVLNPTTKVFVELPDSDFQMVNDLSEIEIMYGFGYDSSTDDYKVVTVSYFHYNYLITPDSMGVHVYSLKTNTWKRVSDSPYDHSYGSNLPGVFVNGFLHWVARKSSQHLPVIVSFSLADEKFSEGCELPLPNLDIEVGSELVVLGGKLAICLHHVSNEVWLMNEYGDSESWKLILSNSFNKIPRWLDENGKILLFGGSDDQMLVYDIEETTICESVCISLNVKDMKVSVTYVESLVSPNFS